MTFSIQIAPAARLLLLDIKDQRIVKKIRERIDALAESPELQGKPLGDELIGFRSVRAVGQRYRIIYRVEKNIVTVVVVALGRRHQQSKSDIYELTKKLLHLGLIEKPKRKRQN